MLDTRMESSRGFWIQAGSQRLRQYDKHVLRHPFPAPKNWREDKELLTEAVRLLYPDATISFYRGGVLRFRWNGGEGGGEAYESGTTPGEVDERTLTL